MRYKREEKEFLNNYILNTSNFYRLPKIYHSQEIRIVLEIQMSEYTEILRPRDLKFSHIVAGLLCPAKDLET